MENDKYDMYLRINNLKIGEIDGEFKRKFSENYVNI